MTLLDLRRDTVKKGADQASVPTRGFPQPVSSVFADLLPEEVRTKRRLAYLKRRLGFGLVALALLVGLGDALARQQTDAASDDLATANLRISALNQQATRFGQVLSVQAETQQITTLLTQAMSGDVPWAALTNTLAKVAPRGLALTGVDGAVGAGSGSASPAATGASGPVAVGTLTLTGTATGYRVVADYVSALGKVPGIIEVTPQTTAMSGTTGGSLTFTITASLTTAAQGGRYPPTSTAAAAPTAGTASATPDTVAADAPATTPSRAAAPVGN